MERGQLHPAWNGWVRSRIDEQFRDLERAVAGDLPQRGVADLRFIVGVDIRTGCAQHLHRLKMPSLRGIM